MTRSFMILIAFIANIYIGKLNGKFWKTNKILFLKATIMRKLFLLIILSVVTGVSIFISCRKKNSCDGCTGINQPLIAKAGPDQVITLPTDSVSLDGTASSDPDGTISSYLWTKISGPASFIIKNATSAATVVKNLTTGIYHFELKITDNGGLSAKDTMQVIVDSVVTTNHPPVANAGADQTITLPTNTVNLNGSGSVDPENNITNYAWTKISGPSPFSIANANAVQTQVANLVQGIYQFELKVTDATGLFAKDTTQVTVINQPLACNDCKIAFVSDRDGNADIYSCNADGSNILRLTYDTGTDDEPAWSPDRSRIAFISDRTGNSELYIMNADGSNVIRKTFSGTYSQNPTWSPDGSKVAYSTLSNGSSNIWVITVIGGSPSLVFETPGYDVHPAWSPDGTKIALVSDWAAYDFVYDIYTINTDGSGFTALTGNIFDNSDYQHPSWSPNGMKLAIAINNTQVGVMNSDGSGLIIIRSGAAAWTRTSWSGNGTIIVYTSLSGSRRDVSWVSTDGSAWGTIVTNGWNADWQP
jgi:WD40-like Beta Propeller Repeat/PKD domain